MQKQLVDAATWAWENRALVRKNLTRLRKWLHSDGRGVLVAGAGGTGKSTFGHIFSGKANGLFERLADYEESLGAESMAFTEHGGLEVSILPGQTHRRTAIWPKFTEQLRAGKYRGILLFNSFGFHSLGKISFRETDLYVDGMSARKFVEAHAEAKRSTELLVLREIAPSIEAAKQPIWLLNVVTKEDLWWDKRNAVQKWYSGGPVPEMLSKIQTVRGAAHFHVETVMVPFLIRNFVTGRGEMLSKTVSGYDQAQQLCSLRRFVEALDSLRRWEQR